jgi:tetratricopeptide (TPR) repeat protein
MIMSRFVRLAFSVGLAAAVALAQPKPKSQKEVDAIMAMQNAQDADSRIKAAQALITKFADTEFKPFALYVMASSYQQKGDVENTIVWAEKTLEVDKTNFMCMNMIASGLAQKTREFDLDKEDKLGRAEKMANSAMEAIKNAAKPNPQIPDDQWELIKKDYTAEAHQAIGLVAMVRKKYPEAIASFKTAVETTPQPDPATLVRLASAYNLANQPDNAIAAADKAMAVPDVNPAIKQVAAAEKERATKAKAGK